jgi:hypothetical protein
MGVRTYRVTVEGELGEPLTATFGGMTATSIDGTTVLTGPIRDQSELQGLLARLASLGLTLLEVTTTDGDGPSRHSGQSPGSPA